LAAYVQHDQPSRRIDRHRRHGAVGGLHSDWLAQPRELRSRAHRLSFRLHLCLLRGGLPLRRLAATSTHVALLRARLAVVFHRTNDGLWLGADEAFRGPVSRSKIHPQPGQDARLRTLAHGLGLSARLRSYVPAGLWLDSLRAETGRD